ncbi:MFS transporter [Nonomuraea sp. KM88]|uniref:MFS transporter n=1 Tax=Nonomuraea sp. KM88 TaxID=3457427 RepID=UPI003FCCF98A
MVVEVRAGGVTRRRPMAALCSGTALMNAAMAVASAAGTLVAGDRLGAGWAGVPVTAGIVGTGAGALVLTRLTDRAGRRAALVTGYVAAAAGACLAVAGVVAGDMIGLTAGMLLLGLGNAGAQLSRYAAAELHPAARRGFAIGVVVWSAAIGAVGGPLLLDVSGDTAAAMGFTSLAGPFLLASLACAAAALASVAAPSRPGRRDGARPSRAREAIAPRVSLRALARTPAARSALVVMVSAQVVMVAVMTAAPLEMHLHGDGLGAVGATLSAHTLGMFALSPVTGRLFDRFGARPVMLGGLLLLAFSAGTAAFAPVRPVGLFLLGYAWNLCFVGGSGRLARDLPDAERLHVEGAVDAAVWTVAAVAGLLSTVIMSAGGYGALTVTTCAIAVLATFAQVRLRGSG